ncbi:MAG: hypothetical protein DIU80_014495 [Chloroflexota bacterium]
MSTEDFRSEAREILARLIAEAPSAADRESLLDNYADDLTRLYGRYAHQLLHEVIEDARTRLDARLSPDPIRQTIATVQTTVQDVWKSLWQ